jgi:hypothetical protein
MIEGATEVMRAWETWDRSGDASDRGRFVAALRAALTRLRAAEERAREAWEASRHEADRDKLERAVYALDAMIEAFAEDVEAERC